MCASSAIMTRMKLLIKGIETSEDTKLCIEHGIDGIIVSNHGGRAEENGSGTIDCLPEVVEATSGARPRHHRRGLPPRHRHLQSTSHWEPAQSALAAPTSGAWLHSVSPE